MNYNSSSLAVKTKNNHRMRPVKKAVQQPITRTRIVCLLLASLIILTAITGMLYMKTQVYLNKVEIEELTTRLNKIKVENESDELAMKSDMDLQKIYDVATGKLGMKKLTNDQVIRYNTENSDYIHQVGELTK